MIEILIAILVFATYILWQIMNGIRSIVQCLENDVDKKRRERENKPKPKGTIIPPLDPAQQKILESEYENQTSTTKSRLQHWFGFDK